LKQVEKKGINFLPDRAAVRFARSTVHHNITGGIRQYVAVVLYRVAHIMNKNRIMIYLWAWLLDFEPLMDNCCTLLDGKDIDQQLM
jgi:hypothetical protein